MNPVRPGTWRTLAAPGARRARRFWDREFCEGAPFGLTNSIRGLMEEARVHHTAEGVGGGPERQLVEHLPWIERAAGALCRRHGLQEEDAEDFLSWARVKLIEDDYAILRKFRGESSLRTYLTVVLAMLFRDYRVQRWGRWRPSAAARRLGELATRLERLVYRDRMAPSQAAAALRRAGAALSDRSAAEILAKLPERGALRPLEIPVDEVAAALPRTEADDAVATAEARRVRADLDAALVRAVERLPPEECALIRLRFWEGLSIADAARALAVPQKPLYRRLERALSTLREHLEGAGISRDQVRARLDDLVRACEPEGESPAPDHLILQHRRSAPGGR